MKNLHLEHPEDSILTGDLSVLDWFVSKGNLSVKMDGAPAIVWGNDPATNTFFVGTKAVFNKVKIRIAHSHDEIDQFYEGNVAEILHRCYDVLPRTHNIYQGDFIGFGGQSEYNSQLLTYQFENVITEDVIVAPHTYYQASSDLRDAHAYPLSYKLTGNRQCKFVQPLAWIAYGQERFADVDEVCAFARQMSTTCEFVSHSKAQKMKQVFNTFIKSGNELDEEALTVACDCDRNLIRLWKLVKSIKEDCLFICRNNGPATYLLGERIDAEGYVLSNEHGCFKLVKREAFSRANFNHGRFQTS
jgi:hypothetical protein